jgi:outer membrane protein
MKKIILSASVVLMLTTSANAFMGINAEIGTGVWKPELSGNSYYYADFSHLVPIVPNIRAEKLDYKVDNSGCSKVDMNQIDIIAYWAIPSANIATDGILNLNFGIDAKNLKGSVVTTNTTTQSINFDETLPLVYLSAKVGLPFILSPAFEIDFVGDNISNREAKMILKLPIPIPYVDLKVDIGYRMQNIKIPNSSVSALDTKGMFFGVSAKF